MASNIIDNSDTGIVVKETSIKLSDEKLRTVISRAYKIAQNDMSTIKFRKFYSVFLSISGTLLLTLLTSTFKDIGKVTATNINMFAWVICIISGVLGFILLAMTVSDKMKNDINAREKAIKKIFELYLSK